MKNLIHTEEHTETQEFLANIFTTLTTAAIFVIIAL